MNRCHKNFSFSFVCDNLVVLLPQNMRRYGFSDIAIQEEAEGFFLTAVLDGKTKVRERLLALDAERYQKGDLPIAHLLGKYCTYMLK